MRGLWRHTTLESYQSDKPKWQTVLDIDALAKREKANWIFKGADCLAPEETRCLVSLSDGGKDAVRRSRVQQRREEVRARTASACRKASTASPGWTMIRCWSPTGFRPRLADRERLSLHREGAQPRPEARQRHRGVQGLRARWRLWRQPGRDALQQGAGDGRHHLPSARYVPAGNLRAGRRAAGEA